MSDDEFFLRSFGAPCPLVRVRELIVAEGFSGIQSRRDFEVFDYFVEIVPLQQNFAQAVECFGVAGLIDKHSPQSRNGLVRLLRCQQDKRQIVSRTRIFEMVREFGGKLALRVLEPLGSETQHSQEEMS